MPGLFKKLLYWAIIPLIAGACLYAAFRDLDWRLFLETLRQSRVLLIGFAFGASTVSYCVRSLRWSWFSSHWSTRIPFHWSFFSLSSGYLINNFVPGRLGDLFRVVAVSRRNRASKAYLLTGLFDERLLDIVSLQMLFFVSLGLKASAPAWFWMVAGVFVVLIAIAVLAVVFLPRMEGVVTRIIGRIPILSRFRERFSTYYMNAVKGVLVLRSPRNAAVLFGLSLIVWALDGFATALVGSALGVTLDLPTLFIFLTAMAFAVVIPSTPGALGVLQLAALLVLGPFGYDKETVLGFMLLWQGVAYAVSIVWGLPGLLLLRPTTVTVKKPANRVRRPRCVW